MTHLNTDAKRKDYYKGTVRGILETLVLEIGKQVTEDYQDKNGIWEGMSIKNIRSIQKSETLLNALSTQPKK